MTIDSRTTFAWTRHLVLGASALLAVGMLLPASGSAAAQGGSCPTSSDGSSAPSVVSAADRDQILQLHNQYRNEVGVSALTWDDSLANAAQGWVNVTAPVGRLCHDPNPNGQGENLADYGSPVAGVQGWYAEKSKYDSNPGPVNLQTNNWYQWGHYSQMVWSATQRVGCGQAPSAQFAGNVVLDCRYSPPGNFDGQKPY